MIRRARLTGAPAGDINATVAGLPVLLRQLLSLQDAGIEDVEVEGAVPAAIANDPRLTLHLLPTAIAAEPPSRRAPEPPSITSRPGLVWHPAIPKRLALGDQSVDLETSPLNPGEFVVAAATPADRHQAERLLLRTLFKPTDGIISRKLNRHISLQVTRALLDTPVTPNQMTLVAMVFGLAAIGVVWSWGTAGLVAGAALLQIQSILDGCDGEISRLKYLRSRLGEWLDQVFDDIVNLGYFAVVGYTLYAAGSSIAGWLTVLGAGAHLVYQAALYAALLTRGGGSGSVTSIRWWGQKPAVRSQPRNWWDRVRQSVADHVEMGARRDFFTFLYLPCALLGWDLVAVLWSALIFGVSGITTGLQWMVAGGPEKAGRREGGKAGG